MQKLLYILVGLFLTQGAIAQYGYSSMYGKKRSDAFPEPLQYHMKGWHFEPGFTLMPPQTFSLITDAVNNSSNGPKGKPGLFIGIGRYRIYEYPGVFRYHDYGIAYKSLRGGERTTGSSFGDHYITGYLNFNSRIKVSKYSFLQNSIGLNAEYAFLRNLSYGTQPSAFVAQLHYKFGFGYKVNKRLMVIPTIETPILNLTPFTNGGSSLAYLDSKYRPMIITIRFLFLRPKMDECPYVPPPPGALPSEEGGNSGQ